jgi:hypothetical protein
MHIMAMTVDANGGNSHERIDAPTLAAIEAAVRSLDGRDRTLVRLEHNEDDWLAIGGGNDGRYVVTVWDDDTDYSVRSPSAPEGAVSLVMGGQVAQRQLRETSDLAGVLSAVRAYARDGSLALNLAWSAT